MEDRRRRGGEGDESQRFQKSQLIQLKSRFVINAALGQRGINELKMIREQARPADWLVENLQAQFLQGSEVLQISLDGKDPEELARLVNAVTKTYIEEVANGDLKKSNATAGVAQEAQQIRSSRS